MYNNVFVDRQIYIILDYFTVLHYSTSILQWTHLRHSTHYSLESRDRVRAMASAINLTRPTGAGWMVRVRAQWRGLFMIEHFEWCGTFSVFGRLDDVPHNVPFNVRLVMGQQLELATGVSSISCRHLVLASLSRTSLALRQNKIAFSGSQITK